MRTVPDSPARAAASPASAASSAASTTSVCWTSADPAAVRLTRAGPLQQRHARVPLQRSELLGNGRRRIGTGLGDGGDRSEPGEIPQQFEPAHVKH